MLNCSQMTRATPELAPLLKASTPVGELLAHGGGFGVRQAHKYGESSAESAFEPGASNPKAETTTFHNTSAF
ncbi:hypothetical protein AVEN_254503-1 [Araneus ventricosus]|uniref:Uncharacterized protein n=1 Tax=Araneus ventricosus TaxID=182803 RepID=A0A4Y2VDW8_ARAVE|nr:hypothetical protein AVEN_254503-1 [Araneus ventricosus]